MPAIHLASRLQLAAAVLALAAIAPTAWAEDGLPRPQAATPVIGVDPVALDFGCVAESSCQTLAIELYNDQNDPFSFLSITGISFDDPAYALDPVPNFPFSIPGDGTRVVLGVRFCPPDTLARTALMTIHSDNALIPSRAVPLAGDGNALPVCAPGGPYVDYVGETMHAVGVESYDPDGAVTQLSWEFGDGHTGSGAVATHVYQLDGTYTITLTVTDDCGGQSTCATTATITCLGALTPVVGISPETLDFGRCTALGDCDTLTVDVTNDVVDGCSKLEITMLDLAGSAFELIDPPALPLTLPGDGSSLPVTIRFCPPSAAAQAGSLTVTAPGALQSPRVLPITGVANQPPIAEASGPYLGDVGQSVSVVGEPSQDPDGTIVNYAWEFGDGGTASGVTAQHTYTVDGVYTITLTVTDDCGATAVDVSTATIRCATSLTPVLSVSPGALDFGQCTLVGDCDTLTVSISNGASDPCSRLELVDLHVAGASYSLAPTPPLPTKLRGDGSTLPVAVRFCPTQATAAPGSLIVTAQGALSSPWTVPLTGTGNTPPICDAGGPYRGLVNEPIPFDGSASTDNVAVTTYGWAFGDGQNGSGVNPTHAYAASGTYTVTLTVTDNCGAETTCTTTATINAPPNCDSGGPYTIGVGHPLEVDGTGSSDPDGTIVDYSWTFGDGGSGTGAMATHTYAATGTYTVILTVVDDFGTASACTTQANVLPVRTHTFTLRDGLHGYERTEDNYMMSHRPDDNAGGMAVMEVGRGPNAVNRSVVRFPLAFLPADAVVTAAEMRLYHAFATGADTLELAAYRLTRTWVEGSAALPPAPENGAACWIAARLGADAWAAPGADMADDSATSGDPAFDRWATPEDTVPVDAAATWYALDVTHAVNAWWQGTFVNDGVLLAGLNETSQNRKRFIASEFEDPALRPCLLITFETAEQLPPLADPGGPYFGYTNDPLTLDGTLSFDPEGEPLTYAWDFGDGQQGTGSQPIHTYTAPGVYTVTLIVNDGTTNSAPVTTTVTIIDAPTGHPAHAGVPEVTRLVGVLPNPTQHQAEVRYQLATTGHVKLRIYDVQGRQVRTLVDAALEAGHYTAALHTRRGGRPLSSGVYFVRFDAPGVQTIQRLTILR